MAGSFLKQTLAVTCGIVLFCMLGVGGCLALVGLGIYSQMWPSPELAAPADKEKAVDFMLKRQESPDLPEAHADHYKIVLYWEGDRVPKGDFEYPVRGGFRADALAKIVGMKKGQIVSTKYLFLIFSDDGSVMSPWGLRYDQVPEEYR